MYDMGHVAIVPVSTGGSTGVVVAVEDLRDHVRQTSYGTTGGATVLSTDAYFLDTYSRPPRLCLNSGYSWPSGVRDHVAGVIRFTAGYSTTPSSGIPDPLIEAIRKLATDLYENREGSSLGNSVNEALPNGIEEMLSEFLMPEFG